MTQMKAVSSTSFVRNVDISSSRVGDAASSTSSTTMLYFVLAALVVNAFQHFYSRRYFL